MESVVAVRYAASLFEVGVEENCLDSLREELDALRVLLRENPEYAALLANPAIPKPEKHEMLQAAVGGKVGEYLYNFLLVLVDKNRFDCFDAAAEEFTRLYNEKNNIRTAVATTAVPMSEALLAQLTAKLETATGSRILLENKVDPSILGGVVLKMDNTQMDASVQGRIEALKRQIGSVIA